MKILIIEDEINAFEILSKRIEQLLPKAEIVGQLKSIVESINWFTQNEAPELVFLDVELSDGQCFEIFKHTPIQCPVIFTTAYDQYAIKAFTLNSVAYLLKPISLGDLRKALGKYRQMKQTFSPVDLGNLNQYLQLQQGPKRKRFLVHSGEKYFFVKTQEVAYFYSEEGVSFLKTLQDKRYLINETLDTLNQELDSEQFFRINRHQIIHIEAIKTIHEYFNRRFKVELVPPLMEHEFIVSRLRRSEFKQWLGS